MVILTVDRPGPVYLVLDERIIASTENLRLRLGEVQKNDRNPLFGSRFFSDPPARWEAKFDNFYPSVVFDSTTDTYRVWYNAFIHDEASETTPLENRSTTLYWHAGREDSMHYAVSTDGIEWERPNLGIIRFDGNTDNNIVMNHASHGLHGVGILHDPEDPEPDRRYKAFLFDVKAKRMATAFSSDGLHWTGPNLWEREETGDAHPNVIRLPGKSGYVGFMRGLTGDPNPPNRILLRTSSSDFLHWTKPERALVGRDLHDQIYSMPVVKHAGLFLGFPAIFHAGDQETADWDTVDTELAWSHDSVTWHRICPGEALIPRGAGSYPDGEYDCGCIYTGAPLFVADTHRFYYGGSNGLHSGFREGFFCLATLPRDRFAGYTVDNNEKPGRLTTEAIAIGGESLTLNVDVADGSVRAGIANERLEFFPGFGLSECLPIRGGSLEIPIEWERPIQQLAGRSAHLVFELQNAVLYAFEFDNEPRIRVNG